MKDEVPALKTPAAEGAMLFILHPSAFILFHLPFRPRPPLSTVDGPRPFACSTSPLDSQVWAMSAQVSSNT